jgi:ABC-type Fe2+-enterobactin transport system substrate-binding protein
MTLSRRTFTLSTLALGLGALAGPARAAGETASITTSLGTYDIPRDPQRVVAIDFRLDVEPALALGLPVVGYGVQEERLDWVPLPADAAYVGGPPSREAIVGLDPDLIVCTDIPGSEYWPIDRLAPIAPTLPVDYELSWQANLTRMGEWLGRADRAAAFIADYQASVDAVRATHAAALAGGKLAAIWYEPDSSEVQVLLGEGTSNVTLAGQVLADLARGARRIRRRQHRERRHGAGRSGRLPARCQRAGTARGARIQPHLAAPASRGGGQGLPHGRHVLWGRLLGQAPRRRMGQAAGAARLIACRWPAEPVSAAL